jgi:Gluconate 2-dehydrogenase subunit 3
MSTWSSPGITRREAIQRVSALLGGIAFVGGDELFARAFEAHAQTAAAANGIGAFSAADVALLEDVADTLLPETSTPGARAARTGAFMALMVTDAYTAPNQQAFMTGLRQLDEACRRAHKVSFSEASGTMRLALLEVLDREQKADMDARSDARVARAPVPAAAGNDMPVHYFRMMKELALLGYFTSEIGYTHAMRYIESPGRFDPCVPYAPGEKIWASHA